MGLKFKPGDKVRQVMPAPITGTVSEAVVVDGEIHYKVNSENGEGVADDSSKYFAEDQIEAAE